MHLRPAQITRQHMPSRTGGQSPSRLLHTVTVPGAVGGDSHLSVQVSEPRVRSLAGRTVLSNQFSLKGDIK